MIITGPIPAENAWARVDKANAVSAVWVITMMPSCGPTMGAKSTNCIAGTACACRPESWIRDAPSSAAWRLVPVPITHSRRARWKRSAAS